MNGPVTLYKTRQILYHDLNLLLPNCMYKMKNIHANKNGVGPLDDHVSPFKDSVNITKQVKQFLKSHLQDLPEMSMLVERQEKILRQLDELREQMIKLKTNLTLCNTVVTSNAVESTPIDSKKLHNFENIILNASPSYPPYSLLEIQKLCRRSFNVNVSTHLHSTVSALPESATNFIEKLNEFQPKPYLPNISLRLIWKNVGPNTELIISNTPINGEPNILRYLSRLVPEILKYENTNILFNIDSVLDISYCLVRSRTKTERTSYIQALSKKLGKNQFLCGSSEITIADIAACSAIKQVARNEINQSMTKWLVRCDE